MPYVTSRREDVSHPTGVPARRPNRISGTAAFPGFPWGERAHSAGEERTCRT